MNLDNLNINEMLKNPEMLNKAMEMLKNDPKILETMMNLNNNPTDTLKETPFNLNDEIIINNLNTIEYNGSVGIIKDYHSDKERYSIYLKDIDKTILIKESNIKKNE